MVTIEGWIDPAFERVRPVFEANFSQGGDVGAALCVMQAGRKIIDIWAGYRDRQMELPWCGDTLVNIFSAGKGLVALSILQLVDQGKLELDRLVMDYWPEFGHRGKEVITVRMLLNHQSGLAAFRQEVPDDAIYDWQKMVDCLATETPWWTPGQEIGYHIFSFGWLLGELVRRVSGQMIGDYIRTHMADPLRADCLIGLHDHELGRVADVGPLKRRSDRDVLKHKDTYPRTETADETPQSGDPGSRRKIDKVSAPAEQQDLLPLRAFGYPPALSRGTNSRLWRISQIPAANMHASARGLASVYGALTRGNRSGDVALLSPKMLSCCYEQSSAGVDQVLCMPMRYSLGFMLPQPESGLVYGRGAHCFGHPGSGGSLGFADPDNHMGFGYVTNRLSGGVFGDRRVIGLINATYDALEECK